MSEGRQAECLHGNLPRREGRPSGSGCGRAASTPANNGGGASGFPSLQGVEVRFVAFLAWLSRELKAEGTSATMGASLQVHLHAYLHLSQTFYQRGRDAFQVFEFEGIRPHLSPNTTLGRVSSSNVSL